MPELLDQLLGWLASHPLWSGLIIFAVAFGESLAVVGMLVPGAVLLFGFGALIAAGVLDFWPVYVWSVCGAIAGDGLSYWLGRHYRERLRSLWPFRNHPGMIDRGARFFHHYGGKSVAIGRFFGPVRAIIPLVAGMMDMTPLRFYLANIGSALLWSPAYLLPGMAFGLALELATEVAFNLVLNLLLLLALVWLTLSLVHRIVRWLQPRSAWLVERMLSRARRLPLLGSIGESLSDPAHPEYKALGLFASLLLIATVCFALIATFSFQGESALTAADRMTFNGLQLIRTPWSDVLFQYLDQAAGLTAIITIQIIVSVYLLVEKQNRALAHWIAAAAFSHLAPALIQLILTHPGPLPVNGEAYRSFPSAEMVRATVTFGFLAVMISRSIRPIMRWRPYGLTALVLSAIALSQLYLGVCWLSDLIAAVMLSLIWVGALGLAYYRHVTAETHGIRLGATAVAVLAASILLPYNQILDRSLPDAGVQPIIEINVQTWLDDQLNLPDKRQDSSGENDHLLGLQYAGDPEDLATQLAEFGWSKADGLNWRNSLRLWSADTTLDQLPVLPHVHNGRFETLTLVNQQNDSSRWVLRLWPTRYRITDGRPLWVGHASAQSRTGLLGLIHYARTEPVDTAPLKSLRQQLSSFTVPSESPGVLKIAIPSLQP